MQMKSNSKKAEWKSEVMDKSSPRRRKSVKLSSWFGSVGVLLCDCQNCAKTNKPVWPVFVGVLLLLFVFSVSSVHWPHSIDIYKTADRSR